MKKKILIIAAIITGIVNILQILDFIDIPSIIRWLNKGVNSEKAIDVADCLNMSVNETIDFLKFDITEKKDYWSICFKQKNKPSYIECGYDSFYHDIPSAWNLYVKDNMFSLYDIIVDITKIEEANRIISKKGWVLKDSEKVFNYASKDTVKYISFENPQTVVFKTEEGIVKEIQILYHSP